MAYTREQPGRAGEAEIRDVLCGWEPVRGYRGQLHVGDVGWMLRLPDDVVDPGLHVWRDGRGTIVAVGLLPAPQVLALGIDPQLHFEVPLGERLAADAADLLTGDEMYVDAPFGAAVRSVLAGSGWDLDDDPWPAFYRPLTAADAGWSDPDATPVHTDDDLAGRVAVQQVMFASSQSDATSWQRMRASVTYDPDLDILVRSQGVPVAAATAWSAGPDRCGLLEPVGTHRDHRGAGHGRRALMAACAALAGAGASGIAVFTPGSNAPAVALYRSGGFTVVGLVTSMRSAGASG